MNKKILAFLLMVGLVLNTSSFVFAEEIVTISSEEDVYNYTYSADETFYVDFLCEGNNGINAITFFVEYDPEVIQMVPNSTFADNAISYTTLEGKKSPLFGPVSINTQLGIVPPASNKEYGGKADGVKTCAQLGKVKLANFVSESDESGNLMNAYGDGVLFRAKFKMIAPGNTEVNLDLQGSISKSENGEYSSMSSNVIPAVVNISPAPGQTTTESTTETTTTNKSNDGGSGATNNKTTTTTTTTTTVATTTVEPTTEGTTESKPATNKSFNDIANYPWAVDAINNLAKAGVINGYTDGSFKPKNEVKRADFILMLLKAMDVDTTKASVNNFSDVPADKYYANAVGIAKEMGIASGNGDGTFSPESTITRQDMMILARKALESKLNIVIEGDVSVLDKFSDKENISAYAKDSLAAMVSENLVNGTGTNIEPKANTTRAQAAVIINKLYDKMK